MKTYPGMRKLYFQKNLNRTTGQQHADELRNQYGVISLDFKIGDSPAFIQYCDELVGKISKINRVNHLISIQKKELTWPFMRQIRKRFLIDEILQTNETEGVHSTRKEIRESMDEIERGRHAKRFDGMLRKYQLLVQEDEFPMTTCQEIRTLYDEFIAEEVAKEDASDVPDGEVFRRNPVNIQNQHGEFIHEGLSPESAILNAMSSALVFLNDGDYDPLIRMAAFHFLFAYIHPFYNGNGRMARFISSAKLKEYNLNPLVSYRLSYTIKERRTEYYRLFRETEDWRNFGDLTQFVIVFLDFVLQSEVDVLEYLSDQIEKVEHYRVILKKIKFSDDAGEIIGFLVEDALCGNEGMSRETLRQYTSFSSYRVRKALEELSQWLIVTGSERKILYHANLEALDQQE